MLKIDEEWLVSSEFNSSGWKWLERIIEENPFPQSKEYRNARLAFLKRVQPGKGKADH